MKPPAAPPEGLLVLLGGGGHAAVVADAAVSAGWRILGFFDDDGDAMLFDFERLGAISEAAAWIASQSQPTAIHAAVGDHRLRAAWLAMASERAGAAAIPVIAHPSAVISTHAEIGDGVFIAPGAIINARAVIGRGAIINTGAVIEHDVRVGEFAHIAPGAVVGGGAIIEPRVLIGLGSVVLPGVLVGREATLGAGAVAVSAVADNTTATGVPARVVAGT